MIKANFKDEKFFKIDEIECKLRRWIDGHEELQYILSEILNCILCKRIIKQTPTDFFYFGGRPNGSDKSYSDLYLKKDSFRDWYMPIAEVKTAKVLPTLETEDIIEM